MRHVWIAMSMVAAVSAAVSILVTPARGQDCLEYQDYLRPLGRIEPGGRPWPFALAGDLVFLPADSAGVHVINVSDPVHPELVTTFPTAGLPRDVAIQGNLLFVTASATVSDLQIFDISDPASPQPLGAVGVPYYGGCPVVYGSFAYVGNSYGLHVVDVSDPLAPFLVTTVDIWIARMLRDGTRLYVAGGNEGLHVVDLSDPADPQVIGGLGAMPLAIDIAVGNGLACICCRNEGLKIVDVSDPTSPVLLAALDPWGQNHDCLTMADNIVYLDGLELNVIDISDPLQPSIIGTVGEVFVQHLAVQDGMLFDCDLGGLSIHDVTNPLPPAPLANYGFDDWVWDIVYSGDLAYATGIGIGVVSLRLDASGEELELHGGSDTGFAGEAITEAGGFLYVVDANSTLRVYPAASDAVIPLLGAVFLGYGTARDVAARGDCAYVAHSDGLIRVDVSDPIHPVELDRTAVDWEGWGVTLVGDLAYVGAGYDGLYIVDISQPGVLPVVGWLETPGFALRLALGDGLAYLADRSAQMQVLDITDPRAPTIIARTWGSGQVYDVALSGDLVYAAAGAQGLVIYDVSNPGEPVTVGAMNASPQAIALAENAVYLADYTEGVTAAALQCPGPVATWLATFTAQVAAGGDRVNLAWRLAEAEPLAVFDLRAVNGARSWPVAYQVDGTGGYAAWDTSPWLADGGTVTYMLAQVRGGVPGPPLGTAVVDLPRPVLSGPTCCPNPLNPQTTVSFKLPRAGAVDLGVYDLMGRRLTTLATGNLNTGAHTASWDGRDSNGRAMPSGAYVIRLVTDEAVRTTKIVVAR